MRVWRNGQLVLTLYDMLWMSEGGQPSVDFLTMASFYGGSGQQHAPPYTTYARYRNITIS